MPDPTPDGTPTPVCPPTKWARGLTAAHAATDDAPRTEPGAVVVHPTENTQPAPERVQDAADTMRAAAGRLRDPYRCNTDSRVDRLLADWLDSAAFDAEEIGADFRAERVAAAVLGRPDPHPGVPSPADIRASLASGRDDQDPLYGAVAASLARGLADSAAGRTVNLGDFATYADAEPGELIGEVRPHSGDPRNDEQARNRQVQGAKLLWAADRGDVAPWMFDKLTDPDLLDLCIMARRLIQVTHREQNRRRADAAAQVTR